MLTPCILISAIALLLLGTNNKYSLVVARIRALNSELRQLNKDNNKRKENILLQLPMLSKRMKYIRNSVCLYTVSIALLIFTILTIGLLFFPNSNSQLLSIIALTLFLFALLLVLLSVIIAAIEVRLGYNIVMIEINNFTKKKNGNI